MSNQIANQKAPKALAIPAILAFFVLLVALLAGCAGHAPIDRPKPAASAAEAPVAEVETPEPAVDDMIAGFGEVFTYENEVSISVSAPTEFTPTEYAAGVTPGQVALLFTIVITNGTDAAIDPYAYESLASGGAQASAIFDFGNETYGNIGETPQTSVLPGQTVQWLVGYSVADPASLTFEIAPGFEYQNVIYTNLQ